MDVSQPTPVISTGICMDSTRLTPATTSDFCMDSTRPTSAVKRVPRIDPSDTSTLGPKLGTCDMTLDANTANNYVCLSDANTTATKASTSQSYPHHPDRFDSVAQVLCSEPLSRDSFVEVECSESVVAVAYKSINRKGHGDDVVFGNNNKSWSLAYNHKGRYFVSHNKEHHELKPPSGSRVLVSWSGDILLFLDVVPGQSPVSWYKFTLASIEVEDLYIGFGLGSSASLTGGYCPSAVKEMGSKEDTRWASLEGK